MGVSGSGKTTLGKALAADLSRPFFDADDFHPEANVAKMRKGEPLNDDDRWPWLSLLNSVLNEHLQEGCVLACSALKESYRRLLFESLEEHLLLVYLKGEYAYIHQRMQARKNHYMPATLLQSQFDTLEEPQNALVLDCDQAIEEMMHTILNTSK